MEMNRRSIVFCVALLCAAEVQAQHSDSLYWVVETNLRNQTYSIVRFYNYRNVKVHEEKILGVYLDITNPKHRKKLDAMLQQFNEKNTVLSKRRKTKNAI